MDSNFFYCPKGHILRYISLHELRCEEGYEAIECDECEEEFEERDDLVYHCSDCKYDICFSCLFRIDRRVDFPHPLGPTIDIKSPFFISRVILSIAFISSFKV